MGQLYVVIVGGCGEVTKVKDPLTARLRNNGGQGAALSSARVDQQIIPRTVVGIYGSLQINW